MIEASAEGEPAWRNAGTEVGLQIWRIVVSFHTRLCRPNVMVVSFVIQGSYFMVGRRDGVGFRGRRIEWRYFQLDHI